MWFEKLLEENRRLAEDISSGVVWERPELLVIADSRAEMCGLLERALGLERGQAYHVRLWGAWGGADGAEMARSVREGLVRGCRKVVVVASKEGPAGGAMSGGDVNAFARLEKTLSSLPQQRRRPPADASDAVRQTVQLIRNWTAGSDVEVAGALLDTETGLLEPVARPGEQQEAASKDSKEVQGAAGLASEPLPDIPLPELPDIDLPEIPPLDLDALTAQPEKPASEPTRPEPVEYGSSQQGAGPVSFEQIASRASGAGIGMPEFKVEVSTPENAVDVARIEYEAPAGVEVRSTGLPEEKVELKVKSIGIDMPQPSNAQPAFQKPDVQPRRDITPESDVEPSGRVVAFPSVKPAVAADERARRPSPPTVPERPQVTPVVEVKRPQPQPQVPLGERVIEFEEEEKTPVAGISGVRVFLERGYANVNGTDMPIDPKLQQAAARVKEFMVREFSASQLSSLSRSLQLSAMQGTAVAEMLKAVITPILRLGKKRYAVINDLLVLKEKLTRMDSRVGSAILLEVVRR